MRKRGVQPEYFREGTGIRSDFWLWHVGFTKSEFGVPCRHCGDSFGNHGMTLVKGMGHVCPRGHASSFEPVDCYKNYRLVSRDNNPLLI